MQTVHWLLNKIVFEIFVANQFLFGSFIFFQLLAQKKGKFVCLKLLFSVELIKTSKPFRIIPLFTANLSQWVRHDKVSWSSFFFYFVCTRNRRIWIHSTSRSSSRWTWHPDGGLRETHPSNASPLEPAVQGKEQSVVIDLVQKNFSQDLYNAHCSLKPS